MATDYTNLLATLPTKLERAFATWLIAKRGPWLPELSIVGAHDPDVPDAPWLSVLCRGAHTHPQFTEVTGSHLPKVAAVEFTFRIHKAVDFHLTAALWAGQCYELLAGGSPNDAERTLARSQFRGLMADLNPGGDLHPASGLKLYGIADMDDSLSYNSTARIAQFSLEVTAQAGDPA